jgi:hypothetical protein
VPPLYCDPGLLASEARDIQQDGAAALTFGAFSGGVASLGTALSAVPGMQAAGAVATVAGRLGVFGATGYGVYLGWRQAALARATSVARHICN